MSSPSTTGPSSSCGARAVTFAHRLPAFHHHETGVGQALWQRTGTSELEVTDEVVESVHSIVLDQAESRLHTITAVLVATLGGQVRSPSPRWP